uniref:acetyl-CoA carboxylase carboxyltransferase beta subunit n=1 Tax=Anarthria humilis TaxID=198286 RepID=UPI001F13007A|nr:acetyl-CoA carboxylase carboxyltransferase beta subunit [Anarthria humilis]ULQ64116.1 acetyl-CoA carboxylase carboxyltransferase beta subunit [Anarthria humilis]
MDKMREHLMYRQVLYCSLPYYYSSVFFSNSKPKMRKNLMYQAPLLFFYSCSLCSNSLHFWNSNVKLQFKFHSKTTNAKGTDNLDGGNDHGDDENNKIQENQDMDDILENIDANSHRTINNEDFINGADSPSSDTPNYGHLWVLCEYCDSLNYKKDFQLRMNICEECEAHLKMSSSERIELSVDVGTWDPMDEDMVSTDPIKFDDFGSEKGFDFVAWELNYDFFSKLNSYLNSYLDSKLDSEEESYTNSKEDMVSIDSIESHSEEEYDHFDLQMNYFIKSLMDSKKEFKLDSKEEYNYLYNKVIFFWNCYMDSKFKSYVNAKWGSYFKKKEDMDSKLDSEEGFDDFYLQMNSFMKSYIHSKLVFFLNSHCWDLKLESQDSWESFLDSKEEFDDFDLQMLFFIKPLMNSKEEFHYLYNKGIDFLNCYVDSKLKFYVNVKSGSYLKKKLYWGEELLDWREEYDHFCLKMNSFMKSYIYSKFGSFLNSYYGDSKLDLKEEFELDSKEEYDYFDLQMHYFIKSLMDSKKEFKLDLEEEYYYLYNSYNKVIFFLNCYMDSKLKSYVNAKWGSYFKKKEDIDSKLDSEKEFDDFYLQMNSFMRSSIFSKFIYSKFCSFLNSYSGDSKLDSKDFWESFLDWKEEYDDFDLQMISFIRPLLNSLRNSKKEDNDIYNEGVDFLNSYLASKLEFYVNAKSGSYLNSYLKKKEDMHSKLDSEEAFFDDLDLEMNSFMKSYICRKFRSFLNSYSGDSELDSKLEYGDFDLLMNSFIKSLMDSNLLWELKLDSKKTFECDSKEEYDDFDWLMHYFIKFLIDPKKELKLDSKEKYNYLYNKVIHFWNFYMDLKLQFNGNAKWGSYLKKKEDIDSKLDSEEELVGDFDLQMNSFMRSHIEPKLGSFLNSYSSFLNYYFGDSKLDSKEELILDSKEEYDHFSFFKSLMNSTEELKLDSKEEDNYKYNLYNKVIDFSNCYFDSKLKSYLNVKSGSYLKKKEDMHSKLDSEEEFDDFDLEMNSFMKSYIDSKFRSFLNSYSGDSKLEYDDFDLLMNSFIKSLMDWRFYYFDSKLNSYLNSYFSSYLPFYWNYELLPYWYWDSYLYWEKESYTNTKEEEESYTNSEEEFDDFDWELNLDLNSYLDSELDLDLNSDFFLFLNSNYSSRTLFYLNYEDYQLLSSLNTDYILIGSKKYDSKEESYTNSEEESYTNSEEESYTNSEEESYTNSEEESYTNSEEESYTNSEEESYTNSEEESYTNSEEESYTNSEEESYTNSEEESYKDRLNSYQRETGLTEAVQTGIGRLNGISIAIGVMDFQFIGGSMGSVVGEKITRLIEYATHRSLPLIIVCASGGARMQEGSLSLMQMAKISSVLYKYQLIKKSFYVSILTSPTTGGVTASFGMLGDSIIAEPNAYIAFAGKRVIEETLHVEVPEGVQETEYLFHKGSFDSIVPRNLLKDVLTDLFLLHGFFPLP